MHYTASLNKRAGGNGLIGVAIDKDNKSSQYALKWAVDNIVSRGQCIILIHVTHRSSSSSSYGAQCRTGVCDINGAMSAHKEHLDKQTRQLFLTFHVYCTRKEIQCFDVVLEGTDVAKTLNEYIAINAIENIVLGASRHGFLRKLKLSDIPNSVTKGAPDFCSVYVISKAKLSSVRNASRPAPFVSKLLAHVQQMQDQASSTCSSPPPTGRPRPSPQVKSASPRISNPEEDIDMFKSPFSRGRGYEGRMSDDRSESNMDISFVSSDRPSSVDCMSSYFTESGDSGRTSRVSTSSQGSYDSMRYGMRPQDASSTGFSSTSMENEDVEAEMRRLKLELQQTMDLYSRACREAMAAKQKEAEIHRWRLKEEQRIEEAKNNEEGALALVEKERAKSHEAVKSAEAAQRAADIEAQKRRNVELKILKEVGENDSGMASLSYARYRKYPIEEIEEATEFFAQSRKIGEGGYGPVFKCYLDHTPVAVKVLGADAAQGRSQFNQEIEVLSCMRHPNLVLLLGACPEYGCLVYEYMANGNLEDRLFQRGGSPPLSWQHRFRIATEIATGLNFLHQTKPEPLVHRDLKPGNILLDSNLVSKISDVGLARLVPPNISDNVTQYRMTSTAGTFCYIDPEYQQTGMLGVKSDVYSLGVVFLQLITGKNAMGVTQYVDGAIENGTFTEILDPGVPDWPVDEALCLAKVALQCAELRRKDRPDLGKVVIPQLNKLREFADESLGLYSFGGSAGPSPNHSSASVSRSVGPSSNHSNASVSHGPSTNEQVDSVEDNSESQTPKEEAPATGTEE